MLHADEPELKRRSAWRLVHGAVFFVFMCLLVIVAAFTVFGGRDLLGVIAAGTSVADGDAHEGITRGLFAFPSVPNRHSRF
jgi:hypothetical protein